MSIIKPITPKQQQQIIEQVAALLQQCEKYFYQSFKPIDIRFDLHGRTSGMFVVKNKQQYLRFNPFIFSKFFEDSLNNTVPHEVAHYISHQLFGLRNIRPHGKEWKSIMQVLGARPLVTGNYDLSGISIRRQRRFDYACDCMTHQSLPFGTTRSNATRPNIFVENAPGNYCNNLQLSLLKFGLSSRRCHHALYELISGS